MVVSSQDLHHLLQQGQQRSSCATTSSDEPPPNREHSEIVDIIIMDGTTTAASYSNYSNSDSNTVEEAAGSIGCCDMMEGIVIRKPPPTTKAPPTTAKTSTTNGIIVASRSTTITSSSSSSTPTDELEHTENEDDQGSSTFDYYDNDDNDDDTLPSSCYSWLLLEPSSSSSSNVGVTTATCTTTSLDSIRTSLWIATHLYYTTEHHQLVVKAHHHHQNHQQQKKKTPQAKRMGQVKTKSQLPFTDGTRTTMDDVDTRHVEEEEGEDDFYRQRLVVSCPIGKCMKQPSTTTAVAGISSSQWLIRYRPFSSSSSEPSIVDAVGTLLSSPIPAPAATTKISSSVDGMMMNTHITPKKPLRQRGVYGRRGRRTTTLSCSVAPSSTTTSSSATTTQNTTATHVTTTKRAMAGTAATVPIATLVSPTSSSSPRFQKSSSVSTTTTATLTPPISLLRFIWATAELACFFSQAILQVEQAQRSEINSNASSSSSSSSRRAGFLEQQQQQRVLCIPTRDGKEIDLQPILHRLVSVSQHQTNDANTDVAAVLHSTSTTAEIADNNNNTNRLLKFESELAILKQAKSYIQNSLPILFHVFRRVAWTGWRVTSSLLSTTVARQDKHDGGFNRPCFVSTMVEQMVWACLVPPSRAARASIERELLLSQREKESTIHNANRFVSPVVVTAPATKFLTTMIPMTASTRPVATADDTTRAITSTSPRRRLVMATDNVVDGELQDRKKESTKHAGDHVKGAPADSALHFFTPPPMKRCYGATTRTKTESRRVSLASTIPVIGTNRSNPPLSSSSPPSKRDVAYLGHDNEEMVGSSRKKRKVTNASIASDKADVSDTTNTSTSTTSLSTTSEQVISTAVQNGSSASSSSPLGVPFDLLNIIFGGMPPTTVTSARSPRRGCSSSIGSRRQHSQSELPILARLMSVADETTKETPFRTNQGSTPSAGARSKNGVSAIGQKSKKRVTTPTRRPRRTNLPLSSQPSILEQVDDGATFAFDTANPMVKGDQVRSTRANNKSIVKPSEITVLSEHDAPAKAGSTEYCGAPSSLSNWTTHLPNGTTSPEQSIEARASQESNATPKATSLDTTTIKGAASNLSPTGAKGEHRRSKLTTTTVDHLEASACGAPASTDSWTSGLRYGKPFFEARSSQRSDATSKTTKLDATNLDVANLGTTTMLAATSLGVANCNLGAAHPIGEGEPLRSTPDINASIVLPPETPEQTEQDALARTCNCGAPTLKSKCTTNSPKKPPKPSIEASSHDTTSRTTTLDANTIKDATYNRPQIPQKPQPENMSSTLLKILIPTAKQCIAPSPVNVEEELQVTDTTETFPTNHTHLLENFSAEDLSPQQKVTEIKLLKQAHTKTRKFQPSEQGFTNSSCNLQPATDEKAGIEDLDSLAATSKQEACVDSQPTDNLPYSQKTPLEVADNNIATKPNEISSHGSTNASHNEVGKKIALAINLDHGAKTENGTTTSASHPANPAKSRDGSVCNRPEKLTHPRYKLRSRLKKAPVQNPPEAVSKVTDLEVSTVAWAVSRNDQLGCQKIDSSVKRYPCSDSRCDENDSQPFIADKGRKTSGGVVTGCNDLQIPVDWEESDYQPFITDGTFDKVGGTMTQHKRKTARALSKKSGGVMPERQQKKSSTAPTKGNELDYKVTISDYLYRFQPFLPIDFGSSLSDAQKAIDTALALHDTEENESTDEEHEETRELRKSFQILQRRADQERLESIRFADEEEARQRTLNYYNRRKKKVDPQKVEFDKFCCRPVLIGQNEWKQTKCEMFGDDCRLCGNCGSLPKFNTATKLLIPSPKVVPSKVNDCWDSSCDEQALPHSRRSRRSVSKKTQALLMLNEMKHTLGFVEKNNKLVRSQQARKPS